MPVPVDLSKLSDVVKNDVVKKDVYDKLVAKVNNIDTSGFAIKTNYNEDKPELENKIPDISGLVQKSDYDAKITEIEGKIFFFFFFIIFNFFSFCINNKFTNQQK